MTPLDVSLALDGCQGGALDDEDLWWERVTLDPHPHPYLASAGAFLAQCEESGVLA